MTPLTRRGKPTSVKTVRIACVQLAPEVGEADFNRRLTREAVRTAVSAGARLIVLPELCTSGYVFESAEEARSLAQRPDGPALRDWAEEAGAGDALVVEAREILRGLYDDGLIEPSHGWRAAGLLPGPEFSAVELPGGLAAHWPAGLYYDVTAVEREYFDMFFFSNLKSYKGAFHMSPDYAWWYGYADVLGHLARLRDEEHQLRQARATGRRTLFMLFTGPLMVLAVILALFFGWRAWERRRAS